MVEVDFGTGKAQQDKIGQMMMMMIMMRVMILMMVSTTMASMFASLFITLYKTTELLRSADIFPYLILAPKISFVKFFDIIQYSKFNDVLEVTFCNMTIYCGS